MKLFGRHTSGTGGTVTVTIGIGDGAPPATAPSPPALSGGGDRLASPVPSTWLARPTLTESNSQVPLAGTSHYQAAIDAHAGPRRRSGPTTNVVTAQLVEVADGPYAGSVAVYVGGDRVGSLRHGLAETYRPVLAALTANGLPATCRASVYGGHYGDDPPGWRNYGVGLHQPSRPKPAPADAPIIPPGSGTRVSLGAGVADILDAGLNSQAKNKVAYRHAVIDPSGWKVSLDNQLIGTLEMPYGGEAMLAYLQQAADAGFTLTCHLRIIRTPDKPLRVTADFPIPSAS